MKEFMASTRNVGWVAAGLLVLASLLTWITVSGPFLGSMSVSGIETDDGKLAIAFAVVVAVVAYLAGRSWLGVCGVVVTLLYGYELVHVSSFVLGDVGQTEFEQQLADAFNVNAGLGIYLGLFTGLALVGWGLVHPYVEQRKGAEAPTTTPPTALPE